MTVYGLRPGASRDQVYRRLGPPDGDGFLLTHADLSGVFRPPLAEAPVWMYSGVTVLFERESVVELHGDRLECSGELRYGPGTTITEFVGSEDDAHSHRYLVGGIHLVPGVYLQFGSPRFARLRPAPRWSPRPAGLVREQLARELGVEPVRTMVSSVDLEIHKQVTGSSDLVELLPICGPRTHRVGLRWRPQALWRALSDCLARAATYGSELVRPGHYVMPVGGTRTRFGLLAETQARMTGGRCEFLEEVSESDCHFFLQHLAQLGNLHGNLLWTSEWHYPDTFQVLEGARATENLRRALLEVRAIRDGWDSCHSGTATQDIVRHAHRCYGGKHWWTWGEDELLAPGAGAFQILLAKPGVTLARGRRDDGSFDRALAQLASIPDQPGEVGVQAPPTELEREILREIEDFPHTVAQVQPFRLAGLGQRLAVNLLTYLDEPARRGCVVAGAAIVLRRTRELLNLAPGTG